MIASASCRLLATLAGLAAIVSVAVPSRGDEDRDAARPAAVSTPAPAGATSLALVVDADAIDAEPLKQMLADDLSISIDLAATSPPPTLTVRSLGHARVEVAFIRPDGSEIHRTLDLPHRRLLATETVAYAAANLLRDEAVDLLAALQKASPRTDVTPPPRATAPIAPPPPPLERPSPPACSWSADLPFGFDFAPRVGTSSAVPDGVRAVSINLVGGLAGGLHGLELGAGVNIERQFACGVQVAGVSNIVGGPASGAQIAPFNLALDRVQGVQVGVVQIARVSMNGLQLGPLNLVAGPLAGSQIGTTNIVGDRVNGAQIGVVNVATGRVQGTQIGLVNYADDSDASIGLVSVVRHGRTDVEAWGTESGLAIAGLRHGSTLLHNVYGAGIQLGGEREWAVVFGLGVHASLAPWIGLDIDLLQTLMQKGAPFTGDVELSTIQAAFGIPIGGVAELLVAPTFNVRYAGIPATGLAPPWPTFDFFDSSTFSVRGWVGISAGLRLRL